MNRPVPVFAAGGSYTVKPRIVCEQHPATDLLTHALGFPGTGCLICNADLIDAIRLRAIYVAVANDEDRT